MEEEILTKANELYDLLNEYKENSEKVENFRNVIDTQSELASLIVRMEEY